MQAIPLDPTSVTPVRISIVGGTGRMGRGLAMRWARVGHRVTLGSRDAQRARQVATTLSAEAGVSVGGGGYREALEGADLVVLSVPYASHGATLAALADDLRGRIVLDLTVPLAPPRVRRVHLPPGRAACLEAQQILGAETPVVAGLHHVSASHLAAGHGPIDCDVLVCSDDRGARATVITLIGQLGVRAIDAGVLDNAIALEALTPVLLHINKHYGISGGAGLRITGLDGGHP